MRYISFAFVGEGSSDLHLKNLIENLLIHYGADEVSGYEVPGNQTELIKGRRVEDKIEFLNKNYAYVNLYIVHRDADRAGYRARFDEIMNAARKYSVVDKTVPIITDKMLEAWLLTDKEYLKTVAGNLGYRGNFNGINFNLLENIADPKSVLEDVLCEINGCSGYKLKQFRKTFPEMRMRLANGLSIDNEFLRNLKSFQEFREILLSKMGMC